MKLKFNVKGIASALTVMVVFLVFSAFFGAVAAIGGVTMAVGVAVASPTSQAEATGGTEYNETTEYIDMKDVQRKVELYKPYQTPIISLLSANKKGTCNSWEKKYFAIDSRGLDTTVTSATTLSGNSTTLVVADASFFTLNNTVFFPITGATLVATGSRTLMGIITAIPAANTITVLLVNPGESLSASDFTGVACRRGGSALNPKAASTGSWAMMPEPDFNYTQSFMEQVDIEDFQEKMKKQVDWNIADMKRGAIDDFKLQLERTWLNGAKSVSNVLIDGQTQRIYTAGGFLQDTGIPVSADVSLSTMTEKTLNGLMKDIFTGNNGMKSRFLLGGADFMEALANVTADKKYILSKETNVKLGLDFVRLVSVFGTLDVCYYEQLDLLGREKDALVIDKSNIATADLYPFNIRAIDQKTSGIAKVTSSAIEQTSTMLIKNKKTHRIILGV